MSYFDCTIGLISTSIKHCLKPVGFICSRKINVKLRNNVLRNYFKHALGDASYCIAYRFLKML